MKVDLPKKLVIRTILAELNSFAYEYNTENLNFITEFSVDEESSCINGEYAQFHLPRMNELAKAFNKQTVTESTYVIDVSDIAYSDPSDEVVSRYCDLLIKLYEYMDKTDCVNRVIPSILNYASKPDQTLNDNDIVMQLKDLFPDLKDEGD